MSVFGWFRVCVFVFWGVFLVFPPFFFSHALEPLSLFLSFLLFCFVCVTQLVFRPGVVDLPEGGAQAAYNAITLQDDLADFDDEFLDLEADMSVGILVVVVVVVVAVLVVVLLLLLLLLLLFLLLLLLLLLLVLLVLVLLLLLLVCDTCAACTVAAWTKLLASHHRSWCRGRRTLHCRTILSSACHSKTPALEMTSLTTWRPSSQVCVAHA